MARLETHRHSHLERWKTNSYGNSWFQWNDCSFQSFVWFYKVTHTRLSHFNPLHLKIPPNWNILTVFLRAGTKSDLIPPSWNVFFSGVHAAISWSVCVKTWQNMILRPSFSHYNWQKFEKAGRLSALEISSELEPSKSSELERALRAGTSLFSFFYHCTKSVAFWLSFIE